MALIRARKRGRACSGEMRVAFAVKRIMSWMDFEGRF